MKTFQQLYEDLLRQKVSVEEPLPKEYDPKHLDCLLHPEEYAPVISTDTCAEHARKAAYLMRLRQEKKESFLSIRHVVRGAQPA